MPGFFNFFSKEKESNHKIDFNNLEKWLDNETKELFNDINIQGNNIIKSLKEIIPEAKSAAENFANIKINTNELNETLIPTITNSKKSITIKMINIFSKIELNESNNFNDLSNNNENMSQSLLQIDQGLKTHGRVVFTVLAKEVRPLLTELKKIQKEAAQLSKLVKNNSEKATKIEQIKSNISRLQGINSTLLINNKTINEITNDSENILESEKDIEKKLEILKNSKQYKELQNNFNEINRLNIKFNKIKSEFDTSFSRLRKPLEKYEYVAQLTKEKESILKKYIESPSNGLIIDKDNSLVMMLEGMKATINTNKITVKNPEKIINRIDEIQPILSIKRNALLTTKKDLEKIRYSLNNSTVQEVDLLEKKIESKKQSKEDQILSIEKAKKDNIKIITNMEELKKNIENDIKKIFNINLEITGILS